MRHEFHPEALDEYEDAARYYAGCQVGLELRFIACVESAFSQVSRAPARCRSFEQDVRRCLVHIFPYAVLYSIEPGYVLIIAVMHCSREPGYWRHRINLLPNQSAAANGSGRHRQPVPRKAAALHRLV